MYCSCISKGQIDLDAEIAKVEKKLSNVLEQKEN